MGNIEGESGQVTSTIKTSGVPQETKKIEKKKVVKVQVQENGPQLSAEELKQMEKEARMQAEVDKEHEEMKKQLREKKADRKGTSTTTKDYHCHGRQQK